ncbi:MAG: diaminopimelate epimerase [Gemmatimonadetes bacterium]|nr:diaminopimelate epimerase [Gemmatimonadota bacterium]
MSSIEGGDAEVPTAFRAGAEFYRAHGLGNDYLVFEAVRSSLPGWPVRGASVRRVCDRWRGVGSDGIVVLLEREPEDGVFPLRMFNPDGSGFERSGNGLRILASYLHGEGLVGRAPFEVRSGGSVIPMTIHAEESGGVFDVSVEMGKAKVGGEWVRLDPTRLDPEGRVVHPSRGPIAFVPVSVGNPHAVVFTSGGSDSLLPDIGPFLATHPAFREGTNVQLVDDMSPGRIRILVWERGVGRTSASGTSSCAAAAAAVATGRLAPGRILVEMEGGELEVTVADGLSITLRGPVEEIARGRLTSGFLEALATV